MANRAECEAVAEKMREFAMKLEREGFSAEAIVDAMLIVGMTSASRLTGPASLARFLVRMAHRFQEEADKAEASTRH